MFVGHFGVGLAGRSAAPRASLGTWFLAVQFLDLLWPLFLLLDVEHVRITPGYTRLNPLDFYDYPVTHSLFAAACWGLAFAVVYALVRRRSPGRWKTAFLLGAGVISHWGLDFLVHREDLPLVPVMGRYFGLGLWDVPAAAISLELAIFGAGIALYLRATRARDGIGRLGLWALLAFLTVVWLMSLFGPPPPNEQAIAWAGLAQWLLVFWAYWVDRHREATGR